MKDWKFLFEKYVLRQHRPKVPEPLVRKKMKKIHGRLFVDIGCNQKTYVKLLEHNFERILTIDPNPKWNADLQIALGNFNGEAPFYVGLDTGSADSLVYHPHIQGVDWNNGEQDKYSVTVKRFDSLGLYADLVKIDVEGGEFEVLDGMGQNRPKNLVVELHDERREGELCRKMGEMGYEVSKIDETHFLGELGWIRTPEGDWKNVSSGKVVLDQ